MLTAYYAIHAALIGGVIASFAWRTARRQRLEDWGMDAILISLTAAIVLVGISVGRAYLA